MSDYPEHDKLSKVSDQTQAAGEFYEWLAGQGVRFMVWREDLTDTRPTNPECEVRRDKDTPRPCDQTRDDGDHSVMYWMRHCSCWQEPDSDGEYGECCYCGQGRIYEITTKGFVPERRSLTQLLADWADIDQDKIEAEKRAMLTAIRAG